MAAKQTDGQEGPFVKICVKHGDRVKFKLISGDTGKLKRCINCREIAEALYALKCIHNLCGECFFRCIPYTCLEDGIETEKGQQRNLILHVNRGLSSTALRCPECGDIVLYDDLQSHMQNEHICARVRMKMRACEENQLTQQQAALRVSSHIERCDPAARNDLLLNQNHITGCSKTSPNQQALLCPKAPVLTSPSEVPVEGPDDSKEEIDEDVEEIRNMIEMLEERLRRIEKPLTALIKRLQGEKI